MASAGSLFPRCVCFAGSELWGCCILIRSQGDRPVQECMHVLSLKLVGCFNSGAMIVGSSQFATLQVWEVYGCYKFARADLFRPVLRVGFYFFCLFYG